LRAHSNNATVAMRNCPRCESKDESEFNWRSKTKGTRQSLCRVCQCAVTTAHYRANEAPYKNRALTQKKAAKEAFWKWLSVQSCVDCGESDPVVLDADHVRGRKRPGGVAQMLRDACAWETVQQELLKCEIRCANCHRRKTARERGFTRMPTGR
jgi:hypothetical protein